MNVVSVLGADVLLFAFLVVLLRVRGRPDRILTPIAFFMSIEVIAVWPALVPIDGSALGPVGPFPALLAAIGLLGMVLTYILLGGSEADATGWRGDGRTPTPEQVRSATLGLALLVGGLVVLGLITFEGLPPLLTGGLSSLLDPAGHADQATLIRETRLSLTKGHTLLGEAYAGQGVINAATEVGWQVAVVEATLLWTWSRSRGSLQRLIVVAVLGFLFLGSSGSRSPLVLCLIAGVTVLAIRYRLRSRYVVTTLLVAVSFVLFIMPLSKGVSGGESLFQRSSAAVTRISDGNGQNNAQIVRLITAGSLEVQNGGLFVERVQAMAPGVASGAPFALRITRLAYGSTSQTTGYSTPTQYGLLYADGGPVAVLIGYILSGVVLALGWRRVARISSPFGAVVAVEGVVLLGYMSVSGVHGVLSAAPVAALALLIAVGPHGWSAAAGWLATSRIRPPGTDRRLLTKVSGG